MEIEIKNIGETQVAYISVTGSYELIPDVLGEVVEYVMNEDLVITEPPYRIYFNSPMEVPPGKLEYEMGIAFSGKAAGEGRIEIKKIPAHQAVTAVYKGAYGQAAQIYQMLIEYAIDNDYEIAGAVKEIYLNNPMEVDEGKLLTRVQFPVTKK